MKKFLAVYISKESTMNDWENLSETERNTREEKGIAAWHQWVEKNKKLILDVGAPLGPTLKMNAKGVSKTKNELTAYTVVQAESHEAAAKLFLNHPHFMIFPGDSIEIVECLKIPGME